MIDATFNPFVGFHVQGLSRGSELSDSLTVGPLAGILTVAR
jgi:hypothetical protein